MPSTITNVHPDVGVKLTQDLVLARFLLVKKRPPKIETVRKDVGVVVGSAPSTETIQEWLECLRENGFLDDKSMLTESGRSRALVFLGAKSIPKNLKWAALVSRYVLPLALGQDVAAGLGASRLTESSLAKVMLKRKFGIKLTAKDTLDSVFEAIICQKLGFNVATLREVKRSVLNQLLGAKGGAIPEKSVNQARTILGANNLQQLQSKALANWVGAPLGIVPGAVDAFDLDEFASTVVAVARHCPTGWYGQSKLFINHLYRHLRDESAFRNLSLEEFKQRLVEANQRNLLALSRADMPAAMNANDVRESETFQLGAALHFLFVQKDQP